MKNALNLIKTNWKLYSFFFIALQSIILSITIGNSNFVAAFRKKKLFTFIKMSTHILFFLSSGIW